MDPDPVGSEPFWVCRIQNILCGSDCFDTKIWNSHVFPQKVQKTFKILLQHKEILTTGTKQRTLIEIHNKKMWSTGKTDLLSTVIFCLSPILYREIWVNCPCWLHLSILHFRVFLIIVTPLTKREECRTRGLMTYFPGQGVPGTVNSSAAAHVRTTVKEGNFVIDV